MTESFIRKTPPDQEGLDFEGLRKEGIRIVQDVCGDTWTDYNLHDPGVTILEALCYALTDLRYRTRFEVADYLTSKDGHIDFRQQVLYRPDEIFPSHPVTARDYRKLILSCEPDIDNVWIRPDDAEGIQGLYRIYVLLNGRIKNQERETVRKAYADKVRQLYLDNRNLCEDLAGVEIVERIPYSLCGEIEIGGKREPAKILAEIHFECAQYLCPEVPRHSYMEKYKEGKTLEELFDGVLAGPGYIDDTELYSWYGDFSIPDLTGRIARIEGVKSVNHLKFMDAVGNKSNTIFLDKTFEYRKVPCLRHYLQESGTAAERSSPSGSNGAGIKFVKSGKKYDAPLLDVEEEFKRLEYKHRVSRQQKRHFDWVEPMLPGGTFRNVREYYSVQNHLPDIYGLNAYGVPDSAPPERKAQAAQLKAYLLFFDQMMANFLEILQETPRLFSLDEGLDQSYFHQVLRNDEVSDVEELYPDGIEEMGSRLARLIAAFDNYGDRRNRVLDYLLGIYGESFLQNSLRHFSHESMDFEEKSIGNKVAFLKEIVDLASKRSAAFNYSRPTSDDRNISGLKKKLRHLLGLRRQREDALPETGSGLREDDYYLVEHILLRPLGAPARPEGSIHDDFYASRISFIFPDDIAGFSGEEFRKLVMETIYLNCPAHIHPEVYWLNSERMKQFTGLHDHWLKVKQTSTGFSSELDEATGQLTHFLRRIRNAHE